MHFRLLTISYLYPGYLRSFYKKNPSYKNLDYHAQLEMLLDETSEPIGTNTKAFNLLGVEAFCIVTNAKFLQKKWKFENGSAFLNNNLLVIEQIKKINPEVLWIEGTDYIEKGWVDMVRKQVPSIKLFIGNHCAPYNERMLENFRNLDLMFTCTPGLKIDLEKNRVKSYLVYHAFDPGVLNKINDGNSIPENNFIFSGSLYKGGGFHDERINFLENILKNNIDLKIYGNVEKISKTIAKQFVYYIFKFLNLIRMGDFANKIPMLANREKYSNHLVSNNAGKLRKTIQAPCFGMDMFRLLRKSKIVLNIHGDIAGDYAGNVRLFEATGVGSCLLTDNKKNISDLFEVGKEIVVYDGVDDCIEKAKWLLNHEKERETIAIAGQRRTLSSHTVQERCKRIIDIIESELNKFESL